MKLNYVKVLPYLISNNYKRTNEYHLQYMIEMLK